LSGVTVGIGVARTFVPPFPATLAAWPAIPALVPVPPVLVLDVPLPEVRLLPVAPLPEPAESLPDLPASADLLGVVVARLSCSDHPGLAAGRRDELLPDLRVERLTPALDLLVGAAVGFGVSGGGRPVRRPRAVGGRRRGRIARPTRSEGRRVRRPPATTRCTDPTHVTRQQQRQMAQAIKNAREMALLPYGSR
jgi:hypothetical protein